MKKINASEFEIQCYFFEYLSIKFPEFYDHAFHIPNGGLRSKIEAARFKRAGVKAGYPDVSIDKPRANIHGARIEIKRERRSALTAHQREWIFKLNKQGYFVAVAVGVEGVQAAADVYCSGTDAILESRQRRLQTHAAKNPNDIKPFVIAGRDPAISGT